MGQNETAPEDDYPIEKVMKYAKEAREAESQGDIERLTNAKRELNLLNRIIGTRGQVTNIWKWCLEHLNEPFFEWHKEDLDYYKKRYAETSDLLDKARYAYVIWTFERDIDFAKKAIMHFLDCGDLYFSTGWYKNGTKFMVMGFCFEFAARLSLSLRMKAPFDIIAILQRMNAIIAKMDSEHVTGRGIYDLLEVAARIAQDLYDKQELRELKQVEQIFLQFLTIADKIGEERHQKKEFHWYQSYLSISMPLAKITKGPEKARELKVKIADSWFEDAESRTGSNIVKVALYEGALKIYSELGLADRMKETRKRIKEYSERAVKEGEFKEVSERISIPVEQIVSSVTRELVGKPPQEILDQIARDMTFIPKKRQVIQTVEEIRKNAPISFIVPITLFERELPIKKITDEKEIFEYKVKEQFGLESQIKRKILSQILNEVFSIFVEEGDLIAFLRNSKNISENSMQILEKGIEHHFRREYVASIHIFVPQIEEILRRLLENRGIPPTKYEPLEKGLEEKLLGGLLKEAGQFLGEDFAEYLDMLLTPNGENIRNKVCHGWMELGRFNQELSNLLIDIVLKLCVI